MKLQTHMKAKADLIMSLIKETPLTMTQISALFGYSPYKLRKALKEELGFSMSVGQPIQHKYNEERVCALLKQTGDYLNIDEDELFNILYEVRVNDTVKIKAKVYAIKDVTNGTYLDNNNEFSILNYNTKFFDNKTKANKFIAEYNTTETQSVLVRKTVVNKLIKDRNTDSIKVATIEFKDKSL